MALPLVVTIPVIVSVTPSIHFSVRNVPWILVRTGPTRNYCDLDSFQPTEEQDVQMVMEETALTTEILLELMLQFISWKSTCTLSSVLTHPPNGLGLKRDTKMLSTFQQPQVAKTPKRYELRM
ncbi:hypothetical protein RRG08_027713 [Elysia crispata]|uniref:Uncharacterized protein n=1 Tax=Elysia crispata TaxID=231223 RepID=A0AAE0XM90_9GAST|nr:hypothetical protein RRG08_027713 [Elysia crispata]